MRNYLWQAEESLGRRIALSPLWLAEGPYRVGSWLHRHVHRWGLRRAVRLPARVISIGNLSVGGSGKTPVVGWIARELRARGRKVAILSRGVGGNRNAAVNVVSNGERVLLPPAEVGDEPVWLAGSVPGVPVLAGVNRVALGLRASAVFGAELLILDDGFQHHRVQRDIDLVCIDAETGLGNRHVLPRGPLREPIGNLRYADGILWTRVRSDTPLPLEEGWLPPGMPQFRILIVPSGVRKLGAPELRPLETLRDLHVGVITGIARPERIRKTLVELGARVVEVRDYPDHHPYQREDIQALTPDLDWIMTAKDAVKIPFVWATGRQVHVLEESVRPEEPTGLVEWIIRRLDPRLDASGRRA